MDTRNDDPRLLFAIPFLLHAFYLVEPIQLFGRVWHTRMAITTVQLQPEGNSRAIGSAVEVLRWRDGAQQGTEMPPVPSCPLLPRKYEQSFSAARPILIGEAWLC